MVNRKDCPIFLALFCWVLTAVDVAAEPNAGSLIFTHNSGATAELTSAGNLSWSYDATQKNGSTITPVSGDLVFKQTSTANPEKLRLSAHDQVMEVREEYRSQDMGSAALTNSLLFKHNDSPNEPPAFLTATDGSMDGALFHTGDLYINNEAIPLSSVTYVDGIGVFETDHINSQTSFYANLPGGEGKVVYPDNSNGYYPTYYYIKDHLPTYYYIKDHLGSTRCVIDHFGDVVEAVSYYAYGRMDYEGLQEPTDKEAREKFTGKEFDQDGGDYSHAYLDLDICIHDLHVDSSDQKAIIIHFADGTSQSYSIYRNRDEEWSRRDDSLVFTEDRVITQM
ncbi:MAG: hypothetical protein GF344_03460, partial [Chitinivibrionales bacterium]|nr:hypothetical protein [Chitinivibrionales bacterium]MBD3356129.1 hypothetical protein [Chitinivibrionales bacterium]